MARQVALIAATVLLAAACQSAGDAAPDGLLAIVDEDGQLVVVTPDGEPVAEPTSLGDGAEVFQPIWSGPEHVVYVEREDLGGSLVVATAGGTEQRRVEFSTAPFYLYPEPGGDGTADIVSLRNHVEGGLAAEVVHDDGSLTTLEGDFPFYFTWNDEGQVVAHSENASLGVVYPDPEPVATALGGFGPPGSRGNDLVFIRSAGSASILTLLAGEDTTDLGSISGYTQLVVGGDRVAVRAVGGGGPPGAVEVAAQPIPPVRAGTLAVIGLDDGAITPVTTEEVLVFFFDPTGSRLLMLTIESVELAELSWKVWEDGNIENFATFRPEPSWIVEFAQFFDQYAQSMTLWSPTGDAFAFPGMVGGESGVWVQELDRTEPVRVSSGSWVAWGPAG